MKKITLLMLPILLVTMVSCGLKDNSWNGNSNVLLKLDGHILQQVNNNVFAGEKPDGDAEPRIVDFVCTISGDYSDTQTQPVDFANEVNTVSFTFDGVPVGGIIDVEMVLILKGTGAELYRGKTEGVKVLPNNATKVQIRLSKADEKLKDLFYPKTVFDGEWVTSKKNAILGNRGDLYYLDDSQLTQTPPPEILEESDVKDYCFDSNGEVWYVKNNNGALELFKNSNENKVVDGWDSQYEDIFKRIFSCHLYYDKITDCIWFCHNEDNEYSFIVYNTKTKNISQYKKIMDYMDACTFAVHNEHIYITTKEEEGDKVINTLYKYSLVDKEVKFDKKTSLDSTQSITSNTTFFTPTDMEIQSDLLFVTYSVNSMDLDGNFTYGVYNYGGVLIFNLDDLTQVIPTGSSKTGVGSISGARKVGLKDKVYVGLEDYYTYLVVRDESSKNQYATYIEFSPNLSLYTPNTDSSTTQFFGAQQIVGIKPKKLVILDQGVFLYVDSEGLTKSKEIARLVELDFESLTFATQTPVVLEGVINNYPAYKVSYLADEYMAEYAYEYSSGGTQYAYLKDTYRDNPNPPMINFSNQNYTD